MSDLSENTWITTLNEFPHEVIRVEDLKKAIKELKDRIKNSEIGKLVIEEIDEIFGELAK